MTLRICASLAIFWTAAPAEEIVVAQRILPPHGVKIPDGERQALQIELTRVSQAFSGLSKRRENANAEVFIKAVRYALDMDEFFKPDETRIARELLAEAERRVDETEHSILDQIAQLNRVRHRRGDAARQRFHEGKAGGDPDTLTGGERLTLHL